MLGQIGADANGALLRASLASAGVDLARLSEDSGVASGVALISIDGSGQNQIVIVPGANGTFNVERLERQRDAFDGAAVVLLQLEIPLPTVERAARLAKERGALVMLDPAPARPLPDSLLADVDYLTPNEIELAALTDSTDLTEAGRLRSRGVKNVLVKLGERGAMLINAEGARRWPAFPVTAIDTTAAGDCFNAALAVALTEGRPPDEAVPFANAAAAVSVTRRGAQPGMPTRGEVEEMLKSSD
jgi:ribokinase